MALIGEANSGVYSRADVDRKRRLAEMLMKDDFQAREPFGALAKALTGARAGFEDAQADQGEKQGNQIMADLLKSKDWQGVMGSEWATPQNLAMASMLQGREWNQQDQQANWAREDAQLADKQDDPRLFQFDNRIVSVGPGNEVSEVYANPGGGVADSPTLTTIYDENGREQKGYMNGPEFVPVGSPKATIERPEFTVSQATAAGYADRMAQSDAILSDPKFANVQTDIMEQRGNTPLIGNLIASPEFQQADQAQRDFINAILRRESGAVISPSEFENARRQYFPQPGDSDAVLKQKAANRRNAIQGVARAAGPAYAPPDTTNYLEAPPEAPGGLPAGPAVGAVEDGFRFKGGDASDPNNWEPI